MHDLFPKHWYLVLLSKFNDSMLLTYFLNQSKDIWNKFKKSSKTGLSIISSMANSFQFLTLLPDFHFWKGDWALGCLRSILRFGFDYLSSFDSFVVKENYTKRVLNFF